MTSDVLSSGSGIIARYSRMPHYQAYYWQALASSFADFSVCDGPWWYELPGSAMFSLDVEAMVEQLRPFLGGTRQWNSADLSDFVGRYTWRCRGREINFAIDAHDLKDIVAPETLEWADIYFKANKWSAEDYPAKVFPIVNGNGFLRHRHLTMLRKLRHTGKKTDIVFISRIWGGIEHNVRLFEALAELPCSKRLVAILVDNPGCAGETAAARKRLERVGVECTTDLLPIRQLWRMAAEARIVVLRAGKYLCIPWRMIDLLCMGACVVTDADFEPQWPKPLQPGVHFESAGILRPADTSPADIAEYGKLRDVITGLLSTADRITSLRRNSADYFDSHADPREVGRYIRDCLTRDPGRWRDDSGQDDS